VVTCAAVRGAEGAPSSGDGWNHTGVGRVAVDPAGLSVARLQRGAAVHRVGNPRGRRTGAGEQRGPLAALWAQSEGWAGRGRGVRVAEVDVVAGETGVAVRADADGRRVGDGVRRLKVVVVMVVVVVVVVVEHGAVLGPLEGLVPQEQGQPVAVLDAPLLGAAVAGGRVRLHPLLFDRLQAEAPMELVFQTLPSSRAVLPLRIQRLAFTQPTAALDGRVQPGVSRTLWARLRVLELVRVSGPRCSFGRRRGSLSRFAAHLAPSRGRRFTPARRLGLRLLLPPGSVLGARESEQRGRGEARLAPRRRSEQRRPVDVRSRRRRPPLFLRSFLWVRFPSRRNLFGFLTSVFGFSDTVSSFIFTGRLPPFLCVIRRQRIVSVEQQAVDRLGVERGHPPPAGLKDGCGEHE